MENLKKQLAEDIRIAMKAGFDGTLKLATLRMVASAISNKEIELRKKDVGLSDHEILDVIAGEAKKRKDAAEEFRKGGREELFQKEEAEFKILKSYLPPEISDEDLMRIVRDGIRETGASDIGDFGRVMKVIMPVLKGKASGDRIAETLKAELEKNDRI